MITEFIIPGVPVSQGRPRARKAGNKIIMYDPPKSKDYKEYVALIAKQHAPKMPYGGPLSVSLKIYRPIPKSTTNKDRRLIEQGLKLPTTKPDTDNYIKSVLDSCNGIIWADDSQVVDLRATKHYSDNPRVEMQVMDLSVSL